MLKRCVIIPAFNEEKTVGRVIAGIKASTDADLVVIDDGSQDRTAEISTNAGAYVIRHPFNMGYGAALQTGYKYALQENYDALVQMDADGQHDPGSIPDFFSQIAAGQCHVIIGSRFLGNKNYPIGLLKSAAIWIFKKIIWIISRQRITDPTSGYQCLHRRVFSFFVDDGFPSDYPDANIIVCLYRLGFVVKEIPVTMVQNPCGKSMHRGLWTIAYYFFNIFLSLFVGLIRRKPF
ncbi:MAG: glycosyltransferase family 2 protein [Desulfobacterales bacterium]|nr:glycosyltransferase family 2 protein [Desulfobacterales bacterium]